MQLPSWCRCCWHLTAVTQSVLALRDTVATVQVCPPLGGQQDLHSWLRRLDEWNGHKLTSTSLSSSLVMLGATHGSYSCPRSRTQPQEPGKSPGPEAACRATCFLRGPVLLGLCRAASSAPQPSWLVVGGREVCGGPSCANRRVASRLCRQTELVYCHEQRGVKLTITIIKTSLHLHIYKRIYISLDNTGGSAQSWH